MSLGPEHSGARESPDKNFQTPNDTPEKEKVESGFDRLTAELKLLRAQIAENQKLLEEIVGILRGRLHIRPAHSAVEPFDFIGIDVAVQDYGLSPGRWRQLAARGTVQASKSKHGWKLDRESAEQYINEEHKPGRPSKM